MHKNISADKTTPRGINPFPLFQRHSAEHSQTNKEQQAPLTMSAVFVVFLREL